MPIWYATDGSWGYWELPSAFVGSTYSTSTTTWYAATTSATGTYTNTPTTSQYLLPLQMTPSRLQYAAYMQQHLALLQQQHAMQQQQLAAQQNRYQPMGQLGQGQLGQLYQPQPRPLAAPAILRGATPDGLRRPRRSDESMEAYHARRVELEQVQEANTVRFREIQARATEVAQRRAQADQRAMALLREHLSEAQLVTLAVEGYFIVHAQSGKRYRIRINGGIAGNIDELAANDNRVTHRLCCHMEHAIPSADHFLAQKLMLESAEDDFLRIANRNRA